MSGGRRASRRDLFRLLGETLAELADGSRPAEAAREAGRVLSAAAGAPPSGRLPPAPATPVPRERDRLVVDLARHPVPVARGRRFVAEGGDGAVLLVVRVTPDHFAAVDGDCPHCGGALAFDVPTDAVLCPGGQVAFRMDGRPLRGPADLRVRSWPCHLAGPRLEVGVGASVRA